MAQYVNKRGKTVVLEVSGHARGRFARRWSLVFPSKPLPNEMVDEELERQFLNADLVKNLSNVDKARRERHGSDSMYFRNSHFTFVVQNATIVTVEISDPDKRGMNKGRPWWLRI